MIEESHLARSWRAVKTVVKVAVGLLLALLAVSLFAAGLLENSMTLVASALVPTFLVADMYLTSRQRWSIGFWHRILVGIGLIVLVIGAATWDHRRVRGDVSAEQLCNEVIASPSEALRRYDGGRWIVSGDFIQISASRVALGGGPAPGESYVGCHRDGLEKVDRTSREFYSRELVLEGWIADGHAAPQSGTKVRAVCRIKVNGFGFYQFSEIDPWVSLSECRPA